MKKISVVALAVILVLSMAACGSSSKYQDGTYTARMSDAYAAENSHGWSDTLTITVSDGEITYVDFDSFDADGNRKSEQTTETYPMDPPPSEWMPKLEENIKKAKSGDEVDAVSGATMASNAARELYDVVLVAAENGNTDVQVLH